MHHPPHDYSDYVADADHWFSVAFDLLSSAEALEPLIRDYWRNQAERQQRRESSSGFLIGVSEPDPRSIHFMLIAYAIENLCKGFIVENQTEEMRLSAAETEKLPKELFGHGLDKLLRRIGFRMERADIEIAKRLERCAVWSARYPVPRRANISFSFRTPEGVRLL